MSLQTESIKLRIAATVQLLADLEFQLKEAEKTEEAERLQAEYSEMVEAKRQEKLAFELRAFQDELEYEFWYSFTQAVPAYIMPQFRKYLIICILYRRQKRFGKKTPSIHYKADV